MTDCREGNECAPEDQEQAFTKFFRTARSRQTAIPGAGLGLPVSKTIIEGHGGFPSLTRAPGEGTTATFVLPGSLTASLDPEAEVFSSP